MNLSQTEAIEALRNQLKEARKIIRASSSRHLSKDWDARTTKLLAETEGFKDKEKQE